MNNDTIPKNYVIHLQSKTCSFKNLKNLPFPLELCIEKRGSGIDWLWFFNAKQDF